MQKVLQVLRGLVLRWPQPRSFLLLSLWCWVRFLFPVPGWADRYRCFKRGQTSWPVPDRPDANPVIPWPVQWIPYTQRGLTNPEDIQRGFGFLPGVCVETGKSCEVGRAVSCLRCGVPLSEKAAGMLSGFDPPACPRCRSRILRVY